MSKQQEIAQEYPMNDDIDVKNIDLKQVMRNIWKYIAQYTPEHRLPEVHMNPKWDPTVLKHVIAKAHDCIKGEALVLDIQDSFTVIGPLYGHGDSLISLLSIVGLPPDHQFVFLGNYMGQGFAPVEVLIFVLALKAMFPERVHLLRGNMEDRQVMTELRITQMLLERGVDAKSEGQICLALFQLFADMPMAATAGNIVLMNGGPGEHLKMKGFNRPEMLDKDMKGERTLSDNLVMMDAMWAMLQPNDTTETEEDPDEKADKEEEINGMPSFDEDDVNEFLSENGFSMLVRGRQFVEEGVLVYPHNVMTIASAVSYVDVFSNAAAAVTFDGNKAMVHRYRMGNVEARTLDYAKLGMGRNALH